MNQLEFDQMCDACKGTGVYQGLAERDGAAVVCYECKGTGIVHTIIKYENPPAHRLFKWGVERVYEWSGGLVIGKSEELGLTLESFGGMPYQDWLDDKPFPPKSENRAFMCPTWWYQGKTPRHEIDWCEAHLGMRFNRCPKFCDRAKCWERWDTDRAKEREDDDEA